MNKRENIRVAIAGVGNCAGSLIEGVNYYKETGDEAGLLFQTIDNYKATDIDFVLAFDISEKKVGQLLIESIYKYPNNFNRNNLDLLPNEAQVFRGPTLDGNPAHLSNFVKESNHPPADIQQLLIQYRVDVLLCLLPTGSHEAAKFYANAALSSNVAFINCIPTPLAQLNDFQSKFKNKNLPIFGDDIKSQIGTTILHRTLLYMFKMRGAKINSTSQINVGGNMDFQNFRYRAESKLISKRKSLDMYINDEQMHVGHHFDPTKGAYKQAYIEIEGTVFGGSKVRIDVKLLSDDKPNSAGTLIDLIRFAKALKTMGIGGFNEDICAYYFKSPPIQKNDYISFSNISAKWLS